MRGGLPPRIRIDTDADNLNHRKAINLVNAAEEALAEAIALINKIDNATYRRNARDHLGSLAKHIAPFAVPPKP